MAKWDFDVIVIGSGPAGEGAAMNAAKHERRVAMIEARAQVGGNCAHLGTIPSKALRHSVKEIMQFNSDPMFREIAEVARLPFQKVLECAERVRKKQVKLRTAFYSRNQVEIINASASFIDRHTIELPIGSGDKYRRITADYIIIAVGSRPYRPDNVDFKHSQIYDSDSILKLKHNPQKLIIYGAGVVGCEYASIFGGLGVKVDLIDANENLLPFLDPEISDALGYHLRNNDVLVKANERFKSLEYVDNSVVVHLQSNKRIRGDAFLWCLGRTGNTDGLNLDAIGLTPNSRGQLEVDQCYRTAVDNVYAVGDVIGWPALASSAYDQGRSAAYDVVGEKCRYVDQVATGIYTIPEISSIDKSEPELTEEKIPYEVGRALFKNTARAQITGEEVGMLKILFHFETLEILGVHCFGDQASEIVHIGQAIMNQQGAANTLRYFVDTTFNYPTMAEAYRVAALDGLNRIF